MHCHLSVLAGWIAHDLFCIVGAVPTWSEVFFCEENNLRMFGPELIRINS